jgi:hypothetical protein
MDRVNALVIESVNHRIQRSLIIQPTQPSYHQCGEPPRAAGRVDVVLRLSDQIKRAHQWLEPTVYSLMDMTKLNSTHASSSTI